LEHFAIDCGGLLSCGYFTDRSTRSLKFCAALIVIDIGSCVLDSISEEHRPRRGARPSKPLRREIASGGFDSFLFRKNHVQKTPKKSQKPPINQQIH